MHSIELANYKRPCNKNSNRTVSLAVSILDCDAENSSSIPGEGTKRNCIYNKLTIIKFERNWHIHDINNITVFPLKKKSINGKRG